MGGLVIETVRPGAQFNHGSNLSGTFPTASAHQVGTTLYLVVEYERT